MQRDTHSDRDRDGTRETGVKTDFDGDRSTERY